MPCYNATQNLNNSKSGPKKNKLIRRPFMLYEMKPEWIRQKECLTQLFRFWTQVAYAWAVSLGGETGAQLLVKLGLVEQAIEYAMEAGAFEHAFDLCRASLKHKLPEVISLLSLLCLVFFLSAPSGSINLQEQCVDTTQLSFGDRTEKEAGTYYVTQQTLLTLAIGFWCTCTAHVHTESPQRHCRIFQTRAQSLMEWQPVPNNMGPTTSSQNLSNRCVSPTSKPPTHIYRHERNTNLSIEVYSRRFNSWAWPHHCTLPLGVTDIRRHQTAIQTRKLLHIFQPLPLASSWPLLGKRE